MRRSLSRLAVLPVLAFGLVACGGDVQRDDSGAVEAESDVSATKVREGDCVASIEPGEVETLTAIPCSEPHGAEAFHSFDLPEDFVVEGQDPFGPVAQEECTAAFEEFVGLAYDDSALQITPLEPTDEGFEAGDRNVLCFVTDPEGDTTGSLEGAER